jgi:prepilin-type N-terminal cleavage/methylation domain-containing protein
MAAARGFTILELMVALTIAAMLLSLGAPYAYGWVVLVASGYNNPGGELSHCSNFPGERG